MIMTIPILKLRVHTSAALIVALIKGTSSRIRPQFCGEIRFEPSGTGSDFVLRHVTETSR